MNIREEFVGYLEMVDKVRFFDGKKFMWDSVEYQDKEKAEEAKNKYSADGFEVQSCEEQGKAILYTRRVVTEVVVE